MGIVLEVAPSTCKEKDGPNGDGLLASHIGPVRRGRGSPMLSCLAEQALAPIGSIRPRRTVRLYRTYPTDLQPIHGEPMFFHRAL